MKKTIPLLFLAAACGGAEVLPVPGEPPPKPTHVVAASSETITYAIDAIMMSDVGNYGYNLDRLTTTKDSSDVCTLLTGSPRTNQVDGPNGVDNSWSQIVVPIIESLTSRDSPSADATSAISSGMTTLELVVTGLPPDTRASAVGLSARTLVGAKQSHAQFDVLTAWPVTSSPAAEFSDSYVNQGTFVSGASASPVILDLPITILDITTVIELRVHSAIVTFDRDGADAVHGTIAGVIDPVELVDAALPFAQTLFAGLCSNPGDYVGFEEQIRQAGDIALDGTNTSGVLCGGISFGIGFTAKRVANPTAISSSVAAPPTGCAH
jgi:hypothetical protein